MVSGSFVTTRKHYKILGICFFFSVVLIGESVTCITLHLIYADDSGTTVVVRGCALDSGTLTTDTEIIRMSHCGGFELDDRYTFYDSQFPLHFLHLSYTRCTQHFTGMPTSKCSICKITSVISNILYIHYSYVKTI